MTEAEQDQRTLAMQKEIWDALEPFPAFLFQRVKETA